MASSFIKNYLVIILFILVLVIVQINGQVQTVDILSPRTNTNLENYSIYSEVFNETDIDDTNSDVVTIKPLSNVSKSTMDIITVVWYMSTFLALAAFFFLMACSDRRCGRQRRTEAQTLQAPPTPAPSYSEFAPPSYESVIKTHQIYLVPVEQKSLEQRSTDIRFHTINELQKIG